MNPDKHHKSGDYEVFLRLFLRHRNQIFTFVFALVGNQPDTEDIFQGNIDHHVASFRSI